MRKPFTTQQAYERGLTHEALRWAVRSGDIQRLMRGVYVAGNELPTSLERAVAVVTATGGVASGTLAGKLYDLDSVVLKPPFATIPVACDPGIVCGALMSHRSRCSVFPPQSDCRR